MIPRIMAVTQTDIDALNAAIASGERQVSIGGQSITYNTTASLIQARDDLQRQLSLQQEAASGVRRPRRSYAYYGGRGYGCERG